MALPSAAARGGMGHLFPRKWHAALRAHKARGPHPRDALPEPLLPAKVSGCAFVKHHHAWHRKSTNPRSQ